MHGYKSAILAKFQIGLGWHCPVSATARFLESDLIEILRRSSKEPVEGAGETASQGIGNAET